MTPRGEVCVEDLRIGDLVVTVRGEALPVKWIGRHVYRRRSHTWNEEVVPIGIRRFALDGHKPHKDLYVSRATLFILMASLSEQGSLSTEPRLRQRCLANSR